MNFKEWLAIQEHSGRTATKLGLYPDLYDVVGQYPPLYAAPIAADYVYYFWKHYGNNPPKTVNGIVQYKPGRGIDAPGLPPI
jgi:hypothetical protein